VLPVDPAHVRAVRPLLSRQLQAVVDLQLLTAARPGEILQMRPCDLSRDEIPGVWVYRPASHKNAHRGRGRSILLGPDAQNTVRGFLPDKGPEEYLFSPRDAEAERRGGCPARAGERYTSEAYSQAVARACKRAGVPHWHPHQIRHTAATEIRRQYGLEAASLMCEHSSAEITDAVYAERDIEKRAEIARKIG